MKIRLEHSLAYVETVLAFGDRTVSVRDVILDTGSAGTIFSADRLLEVGIAPEPFDSVRRIRGVGGTEFVFTKRVHRVSVGEIAAEDFEIEVGAMDYGFPADGILGLDFLLRAGALIDLRRLELRVSDES